jgi:5-formyltetrahydrofolate cyclo-ligase
MDVPEEKRRLRRRFRRRILALDASERASQEAALYRAVKRLPGFAAAGNVLLYAACFPEEIPTALIARQAQEMGKQLVYPRVDATARRLVLHPIDDLVADFRPGAMSIPEPRPGLPEFPPDAVDWVLVPGLAFDRRGFRLGRGAGYYDKLLPTLRPGTPCWAIALGPQRVDSLPVEPHDRPVDGVVFGDECDG